MLELYHHGSSVCAAKVRLTLAEKGLPWQGHYIDILTGDQFNSHYVKLNPKAVVPTLVHNGNVIVEIDGHLRISRRGFPRDAAEARQCRGQEQDAALDKGR